jgi:type 1 glutamine amidotransferase
MLAPKYDGIRDEHAYTTSDEVRSAIPAYVAGGGRLLALHGAPICFDDWPAWGEVVGARWVWDRSAHPPLGAMEVTVAAGHPLTEGVDGFSIVDEAYGFMDLQPDVVPLLVSSHGGVDHPVLWVRAVGTGVVVTCTLGHGPESFDHPVHRDLLRRSIALLLAPGAAPTTEAGR